MLTAWAVSAVSAASVVDSAANRGARPTWRRDAASYSVFTPVPSLTGAVSAQTSPRRFLPLDSWPSSSLFPCDSPASLLGGRKHFRFWGFLAQHSAAWRPGPGSSCRSLCSQRASASMRHAPSQWMIPDLPVLCTSREMAFAAVLYPRSGHRAGSRDRSINGGAQGPGPGKSSLLWRRYVGNTQPEPVNLGTPCIKCHWRGNDVILHSLIGSGKYSGYELFSGIAIPEIYLRLKVFYSAAWNLHLTFQLFEWRGKFVFQGKYFPSGHRALWQYYTNKSLWTYQISYRIEEIGYSAFQPEFKLWPVPKAIHRPKRLGRLRSVASLALSVDQLYLGVKDELSRLLVVDVCSTSDDVATLI